jgi:RNA polymerase sigma-70 factor (ECF subfamily)
MAKGGFWNTAMDNERTRLLRICRRLSGDREAAEDLAQETLLIAWRHRSRTGEAQASMAWLRGIASNVARDWARRQRREQARYIRLDDVEDAANRSPDDFNIEVELERDALAALLDRAMALLPPETRLLLIQQYIEERSRTEMASQWGLSEGAIAVRLHRGRLALRQILQHELRDEAIAYNLLPADTDSRSWEYTRIWCPLCGYNRLVGRFDQVSGSLAIACPICHKTAARCINMRDARLFAGVKGYRPALKRLLASAYNYYSAAIERGSAPCRSCHRASKVRRTEMVYSPTLSMPSLEVTCPVCGSEGAGTISLVFCPETLTFWQQHPRMRLLHPQSAVASGQDVILTGFESVIDSARIELILARDTLQILQVARQDGTVPARS